MMFENGLAAVAQCGSDAGRLVLQGIREAHLVETRRPGQRHAEGVVLARMRQRVIERVHRTCTQQLSDFLPGCGIEVGPVQYAREELVAGKLQRDEPASDPPAFASRNIEADPPAPSDQVQ